MALDYSVAYIHRRLAQIAVLTRRCFVEEDKRLHMKWSFWLTLGALVLWPPLFAIVVVFFIGLAKECWDQFYGTGFCLLDMASNLAGIAAGTALYALALPWALG